MPIPTHAEWKVLKKKHGIPDGAVSGINLGKVLDTYHNNIKPSAKDGPTNAPLAQTAQEQLAKYLTKLDKKKVKTDFSGFQSHFLNHYVGAAKDTAADWLRYVPDITTYSAELVKVLNLVLRLTPGETTQVELEQFKKDKLRAFGAMGKAGITGYDLKALTAYQDKISVLIDATDANTPRAALDQVIARINQLGQKMAIEARTLKMIP